MEIRKSKWKFGAKAPVMFMIDDLCNKYMTDRDQGNYVGADWGGKGNARNSFWDFLNTKILDKFPHVKVTMFLVTGKREPVTNFGKSYYSNEMDKNEEFIELIDLLLKNSNIELAYHGLTHGKEIERNHFIQEWKMFDTLEEAIDTINQGKKIYQNVTKKDFYGGKYCGYESNDFSDESISKTGFKWWCRHWDGGAFFNRPQQNYSFDIEEFKGVVDIPTTVDPSLFSLKCWKGLISRGYLKALYYKFFKKITIENILDYLIQNQYLISIQEHTSPQREDGKIQYPNVVSDKENLIYIFNYLKKFNLWYATGTEIERYYRVFKDTEIVYDTDHVTVTSKSKEFDNEQLSIEIQHNRARNITLQNQSELIKLRKNGENFSGEVYPKQSGNEYKIVIEEF